jgi:4-hydroxybenzoate polyprenyltransferase
MLDLVRLARPRQWVKNAFVAAPLFLTPWRIGAETLAATATAVIVFCLLSSAVYAINDWFDREADRLHPDKRHRPLASGAVSPAAGAGLAIALLAAAAALTVLLLPRLFALYAAIYFLLNIAYSLGLKRQSILDVLIVAAGFVLRVDAGAAVIDVTPSAWIVVATGLLALFLALAKRRDDLVRTLPGEHRQSFVAERSASGGAGADRLWLTVPFVVAGVLRYLQISLVEERSGSQNDIVLTDRFLIATVVGWVAVYGFLLYG